MFRSRSGRATNLATRPVEEVVFPQYVEADVSACLAALYDTHASTFRDESGGTVVSSESVEDDFDTSSAADALLSFTANAPGGHADTDVLAILLQTIDSSVHDQEFDAADDGAEPFVENSSGLGSAAPESRHGHTPLFIVTKPVAPPRVPTPPHTEVMDLETIAASARESAAGPSDARPTLNSLENSSASAAAKKHVVAEMSAAAEEFVAEQRQYAPQASPAAAAPARESAQDRRQKRRALISAPIRIRAVDAETSGTQEIATTFDVSRSGILFHTQLENYSCGMQVAVVFPYSKSPKAVHKEQEGRVVRVTDLGDGLRGVAITFAAPPSEHLVLPPPAPARRAGSVSQPAAVAATAEPKKPLVLAVDADDQLRDALKTYLENEGYDVIAVGNSADARQVLSLFTPSLVVAEIEGDGLPGYDLCEHVKSTPRLRRVPVVLTTVSAYPSDYSQAHSLGAIVCMAKPYKQERLGHVVRLLAPLPEHLQNTAAPRAADPTRVPGRDFSAHNHSSEPKNGGAKKLIGKLFNLRSFR
ncbi:MAG: response regulator [Candidatus Acidiferrales bacterium]